MKRIFELVVFLIFLFSASCTSKEPLSSATDDFSLGAKVFNSEATIHPEQLSCGETISCLKSRLDKALSAEDFSELKNLEFILSQKNMKAKDSNTAILLSRVFNNNHEFSKALQVLEGFHRPEAEYYKAVNLINLRKFQETHVILDQLIAREPSAKLYYLNAILNWAEGNNALAQKSFLKVFALEDVDDQDLAIKARVRYTKFLLETARIAEAEKMVAILAGYAPENYDTYALQGMIAVHNGDFAEALEFFQKAAAKSQDPKYMIPVAVLATELDKPQIKVAVIENAERIVRGEIAQGAEAHKFELAKILVLKQTPAALQEAKDLIAEIKLHYSNDIITTYYAMALYGLGQIDDAKTELANSKVTNQKNIDDLRAMIEANSSKQNFAKKVYWNLKAKFTNWPVRYITMQI